MPVQDRFQSYVEDQREFFDALISEDWESYRSDDWDTTRRYEIAALFQRVQPKTILDIGCGCGFHDREMAEYPFVREVLGIDYSAKSIEAAETHYPHPKVRRKVADLRDLAGETFDMVVSWQVFEHLADPKAYFAAALKVLRPGGRLVIFTPNRLRLSNRIRRLKGLEPQLCDPQHFHEYVPGEVEAIGRAFHLSRADGFGYGLSGVGILNRIGVRNRLRWGTVLASAADAFCVIFSATPPDRQFPKNPQPLAQG
ncbi:class I SAM-dependent methyltransferase [Oleispirillum naphthae]|uniref:class I SAM-dependent methyltransferase n=1 Tax=Oleispirillum naphthae TaxID=2838853 RepID=UPI0030824D0E